MRVEHVFTTLEKLDYVPIKEGQLVYLVDKGQSYWDYSSSQRMPLCDIIELPTDGARASLVSPLEKFYFVVSTGELWRYCGEWVLVFGNVIDGGRFGDG